MATFIALPSYTAHAQGGVSLIRDTEAERVLRGYLDPILIVAGLRPESVKLHLVNDPSINAFVAEGQNMFLNTGILMALDTPNQITGVMAHETGHMADGHLVRAQAGIKAATVPLLLSMAVGLAAMIAGAGDAGQAILLAGQQIAERNFLAFSRTQESAADQAGVRYLTQTHQSGMGMVQVFKRFENQEILSARRADPFAQTHPAPVGPPLPIAIARRCVPLPGRQRQPGIAICLGHDAREAARLYQRRKLPCGSTRSPT
jgi:predicted Zn-dependent protease